MLPMLAQSPAIEQSSGAFEAAEADEVSDEGYSRGHLVESLAGSGLSRSRVIRPLQRAGEADVPRKATDYRQDPTSSILLFACW